jgi:chaperone required for assembly of F1-ATPase
MTQDRPRRFYTTVSVAPDGAGWRVLLDGRAIRTPAKAVLTAPTQAAAMLLAAEWEAQTEVVRPETMPATRLMNVAIDRTPLTRAEIVAEARRYAETDLVCYRSEAPAELAARQAAAWDPLLAWVETAHGVRLTAATGVLAIAQDDSALDAVAHAAAALDDVRLTCLAHATAIAGSVVIGLALVAGRIDAADAFRLSRIDEDFQTERWGEDAEARAAAEARRSDMTAVGALLEALA